MEKYRWLDSKTLAFGGVVLLGVFVLLLFLLIFFLLILVRSVGVACLFNIGTGLRPSFDAHAEVFHIGIPELLRCDRSLTPGTSTRASAIGNNQRVLILGKE